MKQAKLQNLFIYRASGFTLLEVLVAMAISVIIYFGSYTLLDSVITTDERVHNKREQLKSLQKAHYFLQQDIEQIINRSVRSESSEKLFPMKYDGTSQSLEFTRIGWLNPIKRPRSEMQRVRYLLEDNNLYREYWHVLDRVPESEAKRSLLLEQVDELSFRFYNSSKKQWLNDWIKNPTDKDIIPAAIEVSLQTKIYGELKWVFLLVDNKEGDNGEQF